MSTTKEDIAYQIELKRQARANLGLDENHEGIDRLAERADKYKGMKPEKVAEYRSSHKWDTPAPSPVPRPMDVGDSGAWERTVDEASGEPMEVSDENKENPNAMEINEGAGDPSQTNDGKEGPNGGIDDEIDDPTSTGDYQTDKIKLETGDIIEYLFKDWILEGMAWCLNETGSIIGAAVYETARPLGHGLKKTWRWTRRKVTEGMSGVYNKHINPAHNNLDDLRADHTSAVGELKHDIFNALTADNKSLIMLRQDIGNRSITMENGQLVDHQTPPRNLSQFQGKIRESDYNRIRSQADQIHIASMQRAVGIDAKDTQKMAELRNYYEQKANGQAISKPNREFDKAFDNARAAYNQAGDVLHGNLKVFILNKQAQLFAEHYSQFQIEQKAQSDPLFFKNIKNWQFNKKRFNGSLSSLKKKEYAKAYAMFMQIQKARIGGKDLPSNETLIDMADNMRQQTVDGKTVKDAIKEQFKQSQAQKEEPLNLKDAAVAGNNATTTLRKELEKLTAEQAVIENPQEKQNREYLMSRINNLLNEGGNSDQRNIQPNTPNRQTQPVGNTVVLPTNFNEETTLQAMYAIGLVKTDEQNHIVLTKQNKILATQTTDEIKPIDSKILGNLKTQQDIAKEIHLSEMAKSMNEQGYAADKGNLVKMYEKYSDPKSTITESDKRSPEYEAFQTARNKYIRDFNIPLPKVINQLTQRSTPQGQRSTPKTSGTQGKGGYNK